VLVDGRPQPRVQDARPARHQRTRRQLEHTRSTPPLANYILTEGDPALGGLRCSSPRRAAGRNRSPAAITFISIQVILCIISIISVIIYHVFNNL
jgi:hypothetical protein